MSGILLPMPLTRLRLDFDLKIGVGPWALQLPTTCTVTIKSGLKCKKDKLSNRNRKTAFSDHVVRRGHRVNPDILVSPPSKRRT